MIYPMLLINVNKKNKRKYPIGFFLHIRKRKTHTQNRTVIYTYNIIVTPDALQFFY